MLTHLHILNSFHGDLMPMDSWHSLMLMRKKIRRIISLRYTAMNPNPYHSMSLSIKFPVVIIMQLSYQETASSFLSEEILRAS
jgi:hypothetical protein